MKHIIFTRFAIGVQRASFHERRMAIMRASLLQSMLAQSAPNVHWLLVTDSRAPPASLRELQSIADLRPNFHLRTVDPLVDKSVFGLQKTFIEEIVGGDKTVILSRVDDDDGLHRDFSRIVTEFLDQRVAEGARLPIAATWQRGFDIHVTEDRGRIRDLPWIAPSIGIATDMDDERFFTPMRTHWILGKLAQEAGGSVYTIENAAPLWAWFRHRDSDSSEFRKPEKGEFVPLTQLGPMTELGFDAAELLAAYQRQGAGLRMPIEAVDGDRGGKTRLELKTSCLKALAVIEERLEQAKPDDRPGELERARKTLASLFYSI